MKIQKLAKSTIVLLGAATLVFSPAINSTALGTFMGAIQAQAAEAGQGYNWAQEGEVWKVKDGAGNYVVSDWFKDTEGFWYYLGADGVMQTGLVDVNGLYYYLGTDGKMVTVDGVYNGVNLVFNKDVTSPTYGEVISGAQEMLNADNTTQRTRRKAPTSLPIAQTIDISGMDFIAGDSSGLPAME